MAEDHIIIKFPSPYDENMRLLSDSFGYQSEIPDPANLGSTIPNPEARDDFAIRMINERCIAARIRNQHLEEKAEATRETERPNIDREVRKIKTGKKRNVQAQKI